MQNCRSYILCFNVNSNPLRQGYKGREMQNYGRNAHMFVLLVWKAQRSAGQNLYNKFIIVKN
jgi:hypothetical protein